MKRDDSFPQGGVTSHSGQFTLTIPLWVGQFISRRLTAVLHSTFMLFSSVLHFADTLLTYLDSRLYYNQSWQRIT